MVVAMCSGWGTEKDGIADYARHLVGGLALNHVNAEIVPLGYYIGEKHYYRNAAEKADKADICHVQFNYVYFNGELPYKNRFIYFADNIKTPIILTAHEVRVGFAPIKAGYDNGLKRLAFNATIPLWNSWSTVLHEQMYERAARIIVHTKEHERAVTALTKDAGKVALIPHGVPLAGADHKSFPAAEAKKKLGLEGKKVITILGFINRRKGYACALEALSRLPDNVLLLIAGGKMTESQTDCSYYGTLIDAIAAKRLTERVKITGYLAENDIPAIMAATDICLAPFSSTAASGALSLCLAYNKPIIASDIPIHTEINARIACLELFRQDDWQVLSDKIKALLNNQDLSQALSCATARYVEKYSYVKTAETTVALYKDVLSGRRNAKR